MHLVLTMGVMAPWQQIIGVLLEQNDIRLKAEIDLFSAFESDHEVSQSHLAKRLNIAVGLVNILMKSAIKRGFVKICKVPARWHAYYLTPKGFAYLAISRQFSLILSSSQG